MENISGKQKFALRKTIKELENYRARHTELVSVYIPKGYAIIKIIQQLQQEQGTAENIKSKTTKKNVISALEKMIQHLRIYKKTPENGLAVFSGNVSEREGAQDIRVWGIEPPMPLNIRMYKCDQIFYLDPLKDMSKPKTAYGLIVMDRREGDIALLKGKTIITLSRLRSAVPGKFRAGGQCLTQDSLVQMSNGDIVQIKDVHTNLKSADFLNFKHTDTKTIDKWKTEKNNIYKIITKNPRNEIICSKDHLFFVREDKIIQKPASELTTKDHLILPEKLEIFGKIQKIKTYSNKKIKTPKILNEELAQIVGYYLSKGNIDDSRIYFSEGNKELAEYYLNICKNLFSANTNIRFRENKKYYEIKIYSRPIEKLFREQFPKKQGIPTKVLKSPNNVVASFLKGFFDAEGYVSSSRIALGINNKLLAKQIQLLLLRFRILASLQEYNNKRNLHSNNPRYTIVLCGKESFIEFQKNIGFSLISKQNKLLNLINNKTNIDYTRQILITGREIRKIIENHGFKIHKLLPKIAPSGFFINKKNMSKHIFKKQILDKVQEHKLLYKELKKIYNNPFIPAKISKIEKYNQNTKMFDISTESENFIANGIFVHNSAARFARVRENLAKDFYKKIGEEANKEFAEVEELQGIIIGGPGPTKEDFAHGNFLSTNIKKKILGIKNISYTGEFGLKELVDKSEDLLEKEDIIKEKKILNRLFELLSTQPNHVSYGKEDIKKAIKMGAVDTLIISEKLETKEIEELIDTAEEFGGEIEIVSDETREGVQLLSIGGLAAILRYPIT